MYAFRYTAVVAAGAFLGKSVVRSARTERDARTNSDV
jgi:hypothetical protein